MPVFFKYSIISVFAYFIKGLFSPNIHTINNRKGNFLKAQLHKAQSRIFPSKHNKA